MEKLLNVVLGVTLISIIIYLICYIISKDPMNRSVYRVRFGERSYYTELVDTIPNGGIQFIDVRHGNNVKIFGQYSIEQFNKNK